MRCFVSNDFNIEKWADYAKGISPYLYEKVEKDISDYCFDKDILPVINAALRNKEKLFLIHAVFQNITRKLKKYVIENLGIDLDVEIILYLGLCSGAGWATSLGEQKTILLGIEKIIELEWYDENTMVALIAHELGHIWHMEEGGVYYQQVTQKEKAVFQLYSEGIAMLFEQKFYNDDNYYHQNRNGWLEWCENNIEDIKRDYLLRVQNDVSVQDFFGDWCSYKGYSDVGYFLGCRFVKYLLTKFNLHQTSSLKNKELYEEFILFSGIRQD